MVLTREQVLEQCKQAVASSNANGLHVLAMIAGVIRQVAPSSAVEPVAVPETPSVPSSSVAPVAPVAVPETSVEPVAVPETSSPVAEPSVAPYRFVLNVPEIKDYKG